MERETKRLCADEFNAVSKRIVSMTAPHSRNVIHFEYVHASFVQTLNQSGVVMASQGRMSLLRRMKLLLYAEMNLHFAAFEPAPAPLD